MRNGLKACSLTQSTSRKKNSKPLQYDGMYPGRKYLTPATLHHFNPNIPDDPNVCNNVAVRLAMLYFNTQ